MLEPKSAEIDNFVSVGIRIGFGHDVRSDNAIPKLNATIRKLSRHGSTPDLSKTEKRLQKEIGENRSTGQFSFVRLLIQILCVGVLLVLGNLLSGWVTGSVEIKIPASAPNLLRPEVLISAVLYALLLAVPFVPGAEIGIAMMMMAGPKTAIIVYLSTVLGLSISFLIGRFLPLQILTNCLKWLGFTRMRRILDLVEPLTPRQRLEFLISKAPNRFVPFLLKNRHLALAIVLNIPGNSLIGGGGGIVLLAGISKLYTVPAFFVTILVAVAPVPLIVLFFGIDFFSG